MKRAPAALDNPAAKRRRTSGFILPPRCDCSGTCDHVFPSADAERKARVSPALADLSHKHPLELAHLARLLVGVHTERLDELRDTACRAELQLPLSSIDADLRAAHLYLQRFPSSNDDLHLLHPHVLIEFLRNEAATVEKQDTVENVLQTQIRASIRAHRAAQPIKPSA